MNYFLIILKKSLVKESEKVKQMLKQLNLTKTNDAAVVNANSSQMGLITRTQTKIFHRPLNETQMKQLLKDYEGKFPVKLKVSNSLSLEKPLTMKDIRRKTKVR